jgi:hypothetical protein
VDLAVPATKAAQVCGEVLGRGRDRRALLVIGARDESMRDDVERVVEKQIGQFEVAELVS